MPLSTLPPASREAHLPCGRPGSLSTRPQIQNFGRKLSAGLPVKFPFATSELRIDLADPAFPMEIKACLLVSPKRVDVDDCECRIPGWSHWSSERIFPKDQRQALQAYYSI